MSTFPEIDPAPPSDPVGPVASPEPAPRRIPNFGHALLFVSFALLLLLLFQFTLAAFGELPATIHAGSISIAHPKLQIATMAAAYIATLSTAWLFFPLIWHRSFLDGLHWQWSTARRQAGRLVALGFILGAMMQLVTYFITPPKSLPIDDFFLTPSTAWLITVFGTILAPIFEETCFRGFLVPAFAIAYDWLSLPRTPEARTHWQTTTTLSPMGLIFSAILTSIFFALMHAQQDAHLWAALVGLFTISLVLTFVRVKTSSVAASVLVHGSYNLFVFLTVLVATGGYRHLDRMTH